MTATPASSNPLRFVTSVASRPEIGRALASLSPARACSRRGILAPSILSPRSLAPWAAVILPALSIVASGCTAHSSDPQVQQAVAAVLDTVPADKRASSDAYFEGGYWLQLWGFIYGSLVYWALLHFGVSARLRDFAERFTRVRSVHVAIYFAAFLLVVTIAGLPLSVYEDFIREHQYGLSNQTALEWLTDRSKGVAIGVVFGGVAVSVIYAVIRKTQQRWWIWGSTVALLFIVLAGTISPVYIAPLFNRYTPLPDGPIKTSVLRMARANGIAVNDVFESDASKQSKRISANVSGMLGTDRITLNDNLLERCSQAEIEAVMGHEIGHYVLNHAYKGILFFGVVLTLGFAFIHAVFVRVQRRYGGAWGIRGVDDPAGLPLFALAFGVYMFALTPIINSYTRAAEYEADLFGLSTARQPDGFASVSLKLGEYRKLEPSPLEEFIFFDHPSGYRRIEAALVWKRAQEPVAGQSTSARNLTSTPK